MASGAVHEGEAAHKSHAPAPDDPRKAHSPTELGRPSWRYVAGRVLHEFKRDQCVDLAAALTYYSVLALFPALLALVSLLGVFGRGQATVDSLQATLASVVPGEVLTALRGPLESMVANQAAGLALISGLGVALWSASGYVGAFGRAMNRVYEVDEGRPIWKLRPLQVGLTLVVVVLTAVVLVGLVVSGPVAQWAGDAIGLGSTAVTVWNVAKWPVILLIVVVIVAMLYGASPNVQQPKFRWVSVGAGVAILSWALASAAFGFYVGNFGKYDKTYGSLAGVVVFLLWLWITNLALLLGAEVDAELERARQLRAGIKAEETLQLPPRDVSASAKAAGKREEQIDEGRRLRREAEAEAESAAAVAEESPAADPGATKAPTPKRDSADA